VWPVDLACVCKYVVVCCYCGASVLLMCCYCVASVLLMGYVLEVCGGVVLLQVCGVLCRSPLGLCT
jgi:hypothetical protein